ncbi:hypothetical protein HDN1F_07900 [gamma proteobacterium HdN1]|nr:hypothetical protein HDN1F_07900 [gamma proteobacterium HdN1]
MTRPASPCFSRLCTRLDCIRTVHPGVLDSDSRDDALCFVVGAIPYIFAHSFRAEFHDVPAIRFLEVQTRFCGDSADSGRHHCWWYRCRQPAFHYPDTARRTGAIPGAPEQREQCAGVHSECGSLAAGADCGRYSRCDPHPCHRHHQGRVAGG